ncbi:MAG: tRNA (adenosine(37)-N6)-threonylcarbamoyltransferase complex dimerization subunit type 1 TsaB [Candidatus Gastranaerophilales bacterium]|nr:tRNA (adenosine(37)-N6)-threonylcarbamoyltransferase complex dimerization subunit type 1 TsaB [Candidatus Gastranaerophilales bacterium]
MNILAFDTSLHKTCIGLKINDDITTKTILSDEKNYHSAYLLDTIVKLLKENNLTLKDINLVATNIGPGSFTGIRVGVSIAKTIAQTLDISCVPINSAEILSRIISEPSICALDARKNMAYVKQSNDNTVSMIELSGLLSLIKSKNCKVISDSSLGGIFIKEGIEYINFETSEADFGRILLEITEEKINRHKLVNWWDLKPLYLQPPPIHQKKMSIY